jgi:Anti-sigma factor NepR
MKESIASGGKPRATGSNDPLGSNSEIGRKLKQYYDELVPEDVPDRFAQLLQELEQAETARRRD